MCALKQVNSYSPQFGASDSGQKLARVEHPKVHPTPTPLLDRLIHRSPDQQRTLIQRSSAQASSSQSLLLQMQHQYGNSYVQRMMGLSRKAEGEAAVTPDVESAIAQKRGSGQPLDRAVQRQMESAFGSDFSGVRVHTDTTADQLNHQLAARAFTTGHDIFFKQGEYAPGSSQGKELLAHELTHVVQQSGGIALKLAIGEPNDVYEQEADQVAQLVMQSEQVGAATEGAAEPSQRQMPEELVQTKAEPRQIQRDLVAYNKAQTEIMPSFGESATSTFVTTSAEAPGIRAALAALIADDKVKEVVSKSGDKSWFAANQHKNAQLADIQKALADAGYAQAGKMARSLYDIHGEYVYSNQEITTVGLFLDQTTKLGPRVTTEHDRSMTEYEIRQARRVFKSAIDYSKVTIADGSLSARAISVGGYARTIGNTINFPTGDSRNMAFMVHELTHVWQYQTTGASYAVKALWAQIAEGYSYTPAGKTPDEALNEARQAGKTLSSFNKEQQGDILSDYFRRLQSNQPTAAYQPFVDDVK